MSEVVNYYERYDEDSRFSRNSRKIEFLTSTETLDKIIGSKCRILDVGAGPGAYSVYYAQRGHDVVAVDITPRHIETIISKSALYGLSNLESFVADATNLNQITSESFDVVLCFGPLYHLTATEARDNCINECLRVLKNDGVLALAYINKYSIMPMLVTRDKSFIREVMIKKVVDGGVFLEGSEDCFWTDSFFTSPREIKSLMEKFSVYEIDHIATDGLSHLLGDFVDQLPEEQFKAWYKYHLETQREESILGISTHGLYICKKKSI